MSAWNALLLIPLWVLITPLVNREDPTLFGMPFFYWIQFVAVGVGVICTFTVYRMTRSAKGKRVRDE